MSRYLLYHTLNKGVKNVPLDMKHKKELVKLLETDLENDKKSAIILLICEHARFVDGYHFDSDNLELPYEMKQTKKGVEIHIEKLPNSLQHILHKFVTLHVM